MSLTVGKIFFKKSISGKFQDSEFKWRDTIHEMRAKLLCQTADQPSICSANLQFDTTQNCIFLNKIYKFTNLHRNGHSIIQDDVIVLNSCNDDDDYDIDVDGDTHDDDDDDTHDDDDGNNDVDDDDSDDDNERASIEASFWLKSAFTMISDLSHLSIFQQIKVKAGFILNCVFSSQIFVGGDFLFYATLLSPVGIL